MSQAAFMGSACGARRRTGNPQPAALTGTRSLQQRQLRQLVNASVKPPRAAPENVEQTRLAAQHPGWRPRMRAERRGGHARLASAALGAEQASGDQQTYVRTRAGVLSRPLASPRGWLCRHCTSCPATGRWRTDSRSTRHWPVAVKRNNVRLLTVLLTYCLTYSM